MDRGFESHPLRQSLFIYNIMFHKYFDYLRDNPHGYWFKRRLYGWGWIPVKWQGWLIVLCAAVLVVTGVYIGESDDAPGMVLLSFVLAIALVCGFGYWKGEKPRWQWGFPRQEE